MNSSFSNCHYLDDEEMALPFEIFGQEIPSSPVWQGNLLKNYQEDFQATKLDSAIVRDEIESESDLLDLTSKHENLLKSLFDADVSVNFFSKNTSELPDLDLLTRRQIEEEICGGISAHQHNLSIRFLKLKKKTSKSAEQEVSSYRKKYTDKRFSARFHKDAKLLNKVRRMRLYWKSESEAIPNVFQLLSEIPDYPNHLYEFQDFSGKNVLPDELNLLPDDIFEGALL